MHPRTPFGQITAPTQASQPQTDEHRLLATALICAAMIMFVSIDTTIKYLLGFFPLFIVVWARFAGQFVAHCSFSLVRGDLSFWRTSRPGLQLLRSLLVFGATMLNFLALSYLPLPITISILFTYPLIVAAFSPLIVKESLPASRWLYLLLAFGGVLVIMRPWSEEFQWPMLLSLCCAFLVAAYAIVTRITARVDPPITSAFYTSAAGALVPLWLLAGEWQIPTSTLPWLLLIAVGALLASAGHGLFVIAHRHAPAPVLAPYIYTQVIWVTIASYLVFGELPDGWTSAGCAIVVASSLRYLHIEWTEQRSSPKNQASRNPEAGVPTARIKPGPTD